MDAPRILCLHGGGTNAGIFRAQLRTFARLLTPHFRLVFADAPFPSNAGPGIHPVYSDQGPFKQWVRWEKEDATRRPDAEVRRRLWDGLEEVMRVDEGTGEWVGLVGFSQGGKMVGSLLFDQEVRGRSLLGTRWMFGVVLAGRSPLVSLSEDTQGIEGLVGAGAKVEEQVRPGEGKRRDRVIAVPMIHVHGLEDPGLELHRKLLNEYCDQKTIKVFEWNGGHRVPFRTDDVQPIVDEMLRTAREQGVKV